MPFISSSRMRCDGANKYTTVTVGDAINQSGPSDLQVQSGFPESEPTTSVAHASRIATVCPVLVRLNTSILAECNIGS
jgi:hypothetical protein